MSVIFSEHEQQQYRLAQAAAASRGYVTPAVVDEGADTPRFRELAAIVALVALCDVTIYRGQGFAGYALLFLIAPCLLLLATLRPRLNYGFLIIGGMLLALSARMLWQGSYLAGAAGFALLVAFAMVQVGRRPYLMDLVIFALQTTVAGAIGVASYVRSAGRVRRRVPRRLGWNAVLPLAALALFGAIFILANPDLRVAFDEQASRFFRSLWDWTSRWGPEWSELPFWIAVLWIALGLLRPVVRHSFLGELFQTANVSRLPVTVAVEAPSYPALRNTMLAVIVLFAAYLAFEFKTLWFRDLPKGFYYAGYAHEGAFWLTTALALATVVLSLIFRGRVLRDPRLPALRRLAWVWSLENLLLALAVYNRLHIYIDFNGMTRMRTIGLFGTSAVLVGFILVVWKVAQGRDFLWLIERQLWTVAVAVYLFALTPVDAIVHAYNVRCVLAGDLPPAVQLSVQSISAEGALVLRPLAHCEHPIIREGIRALMAKRAIEAEDKASLRQRQGWTTFQLSDRLLLEQLRASRADWAPYLDSAKRDAAIARFDHFVYQWY